MATEVMTAPISIHALLAESDGSYSSVQQNTKISIHALLAESDLSFAIMPLRSRLFLSTLSLRRATNRAIHGLRCLMIFLSTLSLRRATMCSQDMYKQLFNFYPRSPCGERQNSLRKKSLFRRFLSTLSLRRATIVTSLYRLHMSYFYPRSPCGERLCKVAGNAFGRGFLSTLSLRRATIQYAYQGFAKQFLSTLSLRRATITTRSAKQKAFNFYPRSPCGERRGSVRSGRCRYNFYPRSPCGERHFLHAIQHDLQKISIHALLAESDCIAWVVDCWPCNFYPRSPCGERHNTGLDPLHL